MTTSRPSAFCIQRVFLSFALLILTTPLCFSQRLQRTLEEAMTGRSGGAVVLSARSGSLLALYHPEVVARRVVRPGSVIKPFVLLELLRAGAVSADTEWSCQRRVRVGRHNLDCQHVRTVEAMNAERALAYSCNSYFTEMGQRLTSLEFSRTMREWGFGAETHAMDGEAAGAFRTPTDKESLMVTAVGEDGVAATPIQIAMAYRKLAMQVKQSDASLRTVLAGLRGAVKYGTAQGAAVAGTDIAGKTGTSTAAEGAWTHAWFAGFYPASNPEFIVVVFLERGHGSEAADTAGRIFKSLLPRERRQ